MTREQEWLCHDMTDEDIDYCEEEAKAGKHASVG